MFGSTRCVCYSRDADCWSFLSPDQLNTIRNVTMARILCDNTQIKEMQLNPFRLPDARYS